MLLVSEREEVENLAAVFRQHIPDLSDEKGIVGAADVFAYNVRREAGYFDYGDDASDIEELSRQIRAVQDGLRELTVMRRMLLENDFYSVCAGENKKIPSFLVKRLESSELSELLDHLQKSYSLDHFEHLGRVLVSACKKSIKTLAQKIPLNGKQPNWLALAIADNCRVHWALNAKNSGHKAWQQYVKNSEWIPEDGPDGSPMQRFLREWPPISVNRATNTGFAAFLGSTLSVFNIEQKPYYVLDELRKKFPNLASRPSTGHAK